MVILLTVVVAVAGCGGVSATTANQQRLGHQAGEAFVCFASQDAYSTAWELAFGFRAWVTGGFTGQHALTQPPEHCPPPPTRALPPQARAAAAQIVLQYAASNQDRIAGQSAASYGGRDLIGYLKRHGV